jgi:DNA-binding beta-propeller fold protein YncE
VLLLALGGSDEKKPKPSTATAQQDNQVSDIAATHGALWVTKVVRRNAVRAKFDPATTKPTGKQIRVGRSPYDLAPGFGDLWVATTAATPSVASIPPLSRARRED